MLTSYVTNTSKMVTSSGFQIGINVANKFLRYPKVTALAIGILGINSFPIASAGPVAEVICMAACSGSALVNPTMFLLWQQCMQACVLLGFAPIP